MKNPARERSGAVTLYPITAAENGRASNDIRLLPPPKKRARYGGGSRNNSSASLMTVKSRDFLLLFLKVADSGTWPWMVRRLCLGWGRRIQISAGSISFRGVQNCFLHLPPGLVSYLRLQQVEEFRKVATDLHSGIAIFFTAPSARSMFHDY